jgi:IMP dehydrogenase
MATIGHEVKMKEVITSLKLAYDDVLIKPNYSEISSRASVNTTTYIGKNKFKLPIISSNMDTITGSKMAAKMAELGGLGLVHRYMSIEEQMKILDEWPSGPTNTEVLGLSFGTLKNDKERIDTTLGYLKHYSSVKEENVVFCVDIAHGDSLHMLDTIKYIRDAGWENTLMAGATCTYEGTKRLIDAGADIVRVGVGPGSACTTRVKTGCGYPQLSAIMECAEAGQIIADGGITTPGDAAKALAAGASAVMIGGMLAGTDCVPGWDIAMQSYHANIPNASLTDMRRHPEDMPSIKFRGMASAEAREAFGAKPENAEGISCTVKARAEGSTAKVIESIAEGIRSAMSYTNSRILDEFYHNSVFLKVSPAVTKENTPHILNKADARLNWRS